MFLPSLAAFHDSELNFSVQQDINISVYSLLQNEKGKLPQVVSLYLNIFVCIQINMAVIKKDLLFHCPLRFGTLPTFAKRQVISC